MLDTMNPIQSARLIDAADGDTITVTLTHLMGLRLSGVRIRLAGIQAPELTGPDKLRGMNARTHLLTLLHAQDLLIEQIKGPTDRYGRIIAWVYVVNVGHIDCVNTAMIDDGHAIEYWPKRHASHLALPPRQVRLLYPHG